MGLNGIVDLLDSVEYRVSVASTAVKDGASVRYAGIAGTRYEFAMMDETAPTLWTYSPSRGAGDASTAGNLVFSFSEAVQVGSGELVLRLEPTGFAGTALISENQFSFNGVVLSWSPTSLDLLDSVQYAAVMASGPAKDDQFSDAGITGTNYQFVMTDQFAMTDQAPTLWTYRPSRGAAATVTSGNMVFSFSEAVKVSCGQLVLRPEPTGSAATAPISERTSSASTELC